MSKTSTPSKLAAYLGIFLAVVLATATVIAASQLAQKQLDKDKMPLSRCTKGSWIIFNITIQSDKATPEHIDAQQCDKLIITNLDNESRLIAFGIHSAHTPYDGVETKQLDTGQSFTVNLLQSGQNFRVHDHEHDEVQATFTVKPL